jgi:hypothetical protein
MILHLCMKLRENSAQSDRTGFDGKAGMLARACYGPRDAFLNRRRGAHNSHSRPLDAKPTRFRHKFAKSSGLEKRA